jgi:hypothetical protein
VYFTTSGGLYRYHINDVVRVVDFYRHTPVIQFVRKGQGISSITGEKLTESQVTAALLQALEAEPVTLEHFTAVVALGDVPSYALYVVGAQAESVERLRRACAQRHRRCARTTRSTRPSALRSAWAAGSWRGAAGPTEAAPAAGGGGRRRRRSRSAAEPSLRFGEQLDVVDAIGWRPPRDGTGSHRAWP